MCKFSIRGKTIFCIFVHFRIKLVQHCWKFRKTILYSRYVATYILQYCQGLSIFYVFTPFDYYRWLTKTDVYLLSYFTWWFNQQKHGHKNLQFPKTLITITRNCVSMLLTFLLSLCYWKRLYCSYIQFRNIYNLKNITKKRVTNEGRKYFNIYLNLSLDG